MRGEWKTCNNLQGYYFPQKQLEKIQDIVFSYATSDNKKDIKDIYDFLSMFFSGEKENKTFKVKMCIDSTHAKWSQYHKEDFKSMPDGTIFTFLIEKTDTESTVTLYLEKLCV